MTVCVNPLTNIALQDRRGQTALTGTVIPSDVPRTPRWRGITAIQELAAAGIPVAAASDNVRDHWHRYGDYDLLEAFGWSVKLAHLDTAPCAGSWFVHFHSAVATFHCLHCASRFVTVNGFHDRAPMVGTTAAAALSDDESTGVGKPHCLSLSMRAVAGSTFP
eukprot:SAG31_NODE_1913_length_6933_cov_9.849722_7_plen_163_part_00